MTTTERLAVSQLVFFTNQLYFESTRGGPTFVPLSYRSESRQLFHGNLELAFDVSSVLSGLFHSIDAAYQSTVV